MSEVTEIKVRGAREHNLRSIDVDIPRNKLVVVTGLSGSGKSSLAIDTIFAEGQRRYIESLSAYARQFLNMMRKPDVDQITGLSPAVSIQQKTTSRNPRSTVGTITEVYDYLRLLYARVGTPYSPVTGKPIEAQQVSDMVRQLIQLPEGSRVILLAPIVRDRKGEYRNELQQLRKEGFLRVRIDGKHYDLDDRPQLKKNLRHNIDLVVDRIVIRHGIGTRIADSLRTTLDKANGIAVAEISGGNVESETRTFSENFACPISGFTIPEIAPRLFSFNAPFGACPVCDGLGHEVFFDPRLIVPDENSILLTAIAPWSSTSSWHYDQTIESLARHYCFDEMEPWDAQPDRVQELLLYGSGDETIQFTYQDKDRLYKVTRKFEGVIPNLERRLRETDSDYVRRELERYQNNRPCSGCNGYRLKQEALAVKIAGLNVSQVTEMSIGKTLEWLDGVPEQLSSQNRKIATLVLKELHDRLTFLVNVGLEYLTLARRAGSLSGGESQRIRLASQIGAGLSGVLYVLDEPSIGLHQRDNKRLLWTLKNLRDQGNTLIVVEHDEEAIREADFVLDLGPGAGTHGGKVVASGTPAQVEAADHSITGQYLRGARSIKVPETRRYGNGKRLSITGARVNNLKNLSVDFPLGTFICVTGVSGSGKSSLIFDTLFTYVQSEFRHWEVDSDDFDSIEGLAYLDKVIHIDQRPIGRTPRSNPATYTDSFTHIRNWYANLPEAKARGYKPGRFSFNVNKGRCQACKGDGVIKIEMHFLPDVFVTCERCNGARYNNETLEIKFKDKSIADVLNMTVLEAEGFFSAIPAIRDKLAALRKVGLGYIKVGQQATTLSGGEAQRVKLAKELARRSTGKTLYILDEPTTGLHFEDVSQLLNVLHKLVSKGNTVIVIEHNLDVIKTADWIIDLGPEGGDAGGQVVTCGTPEDVAACKSSHTGKFLSGMLAERLFAAE